MSLRTKIRVRILNEEYSLSGHRGEAELRAAAAYVDELLRQLAASTTAASPANLAILTAINLASELLELRRHVESLEEAVRGGSQQMLELLEKRFGGLLEP